MKLVCVCVVLLAAGCARGGGGAGARPPAERGPACADVGARMTRATIEALERGGAGEDMMVEVRRDAHDFEPTLVRLCTDDAWSVELRRCVVDAADGEALERCEALVTPEQLQHLGDARDAFDRERHGDDE